MTDIFISYAHDDAAFAAQLKEGIEAGGFSTWMDTASMSGGECWTEEIESNIQASASVVVVVSPASNESVWVRREVLYAQQLGKRVVPVLAVDVPLPALLIDLHALALHENFEAGLNRLHNALHETIRTAAPASAAGAGKRTTRPTGIGMVLWLFVGTAVVVVLVVIALHGEGLAAEILATGLSIGGALLAMAWKADDAISLEFKRDLSLWLVGLDPAAVGRSVQRWPVHFAALFDRVFGKKHLSWRCFFRSTIASLVAFLLCTLIFMQTAPGEWTALVNKQGISVFITLGLTGAIANLLPDYISLLETRWVIQRMQWTASLSGQLGWLLLDFVATTAIFFLIVSGLLMVVLGYDDSIVYLSTLVQLSLLVPVEDPELRFLAIPVWTTYFTTVWVWLYFVAQFLMRLATPLSRTLRFLKYALPVEQRPLRAVGQVMALVACAVYCLAMLPASTFGDSAIAGPVAPQMVVIEPGEFRMGDLNGKVNKFEIPVHRVTILKRFAIGKYEVTFEEYDHFAVVTGRALPDDQGWGRGRRPVINVSWEDATAYAEWLRDQTGDRYRLPTESEWEYAARAGTETKYWWGNEMKPGVAVCGGCESDWEDQAEDSQTSRVDDPNFKPNKFELYHTAGNVWEWVQDCWHDSYEGKERPDDGSAWEIADSGDCGRRVLRGGSWNSKPRYLRSAKRTWNDTDFRYFALGFRLAQDL